jgi:hypothetical protein
MTMQIILLITTIFTTSNTAKHDGIATHILQEKLVVKNLITGYSLDVTGDLNAKGDPKINAISGTGSQVLRNHENDSMVWSDLRQYKHFAILNSIEEATWTVPAGVTKIVVELWGGGGGGNDLASGGSGGYIKAFFIVTPGDLISYIAGEAGTGALSTTAEDGSSAECIVGKIKLTAEGGKGAIFLNDFNRQGGSGGGSYVTGSPTNYIALPGRSGKVLQRFSNQDIANTLSQNTKAGNTGETPNHPERVGIDQRNLNNANDSTSIFRNGTQSTELVPGSGGASGVINIATNSRVRGGNGLRGVIIIHY